jgi:alanine dehydrogenase
MMNHAIGIVRERKTGEHRVALTPAHVEILVKKHRRMVYVETGAGEDIGYTDADYQNAGAIVSSKKDLFDNCKFIIKVKEPNIFDLPFITEKHVLFCYLHLAASPELTKELIDKKVTAIAFESIIEHKRSAYTLPLLTPMSIIAGKLAIHMAHDVLRSQRYELIDEKSNVVVVGAGNVGTNAARVALALGARVTLFDVSSARLEYAYDQLYPIHGNVDTVCLSEYPDALNNMLRDPASKIAVVVCGALVPDDKAPKLITNETLTIMNGPQFRPTVFVDVSIDQGGCVEGIKETNLNQTWYEEGKHFFVAVPNMPGSVARTASKALADEILPYAILLGAFVNNDTLAMDLSNIETLESFNTGMALRDGKIINETLKQLYGKNGEKI